ncbi:MAG TPA: hypothetical protein VHI13_17905 [Candidatus Kapabacteria bacterium]|nr:hypothetical protein [Candidatus Kapabacteria bacterium]
MSDFCTIVSPVIDHARIRSVLGSHGTADIVVTGSDQAWTSIVLRTDAATLTLNSMIRVEPGDQFSTILLGLYNFVRTQPASDPAAKDRLQQQIVDAELLIGVVADPSFEADETLADLVFEIAEDLGALIFTGSALLSGNGDVLIEQP